MLNPKPYIKKERPVVYQSPLKGDGRFLFYLNKAAQTLIRVDLNDLAQSSVAFPAGFNFKTGIYCPDLDKCVVFGSNRYAIIDPYTLTVDSDDQLSDGGGISSNCVDYNWVDKVFIHSDDTNANNQTRFFDLNIKEVSTFSITTKGKYYLKFVPPSFVWGSVYTPGALNGKGQVVFTDDFKKKFGARSAMVDYTGLSFTQAIWVEEFKTLYTSGASTTFAANGPVNYGVVNSNVNEGSLIYDGNSRYVVTCRGNGAANHVFSRFSPTSRIFISNNSTKALAGSETGCKQMCWSPYTNKVYARPDAGGSATSRIIVYDAATDSFDADIAITSNATIWERSRTMWLNYIPL